MASPAAWLLVRSKVTGDGEDAGGGVYERPLQIRSPGTMQRWHVREQQIRLRRRGSAFLLRHGSASGGLTARIVTGDGVCMTSSVYIGAWRGLWL